MCKSNFELTDLNFEPQLKQKVQISNSKWEVFCFVVKCSTIKQIFSIFLRHLLSVTSLFSWLNRRELDLFPTKLRLRNVFDFVFQKAW